MRTHNLPRKALAPAILALLLTTACTTPTPVNPKAPASASASASATVTAPPASAPASAPTLGSASTSNTGHDAEHAQKFAQWVADFCTTARADGISDATLKMAFDDVHFLPRVIELDTTQPEFTRAIWDYLDGALSAQRVARGRDRLSQVRASVDPIATRYGVPTEVLAAIWGMESSYGIYMGDMPTIDALATLGFEGRREQWARGQLLAALKILQNGDIDRAHMVGSWAGAMGQTQFLPSVFLAHAVDADGDGRRDIWGSVPDVMASTANYLRHSGWQTGQAWGTQVRLPATFDYAHADPDIRQTSEQWLAEGVRTMDGTPLPPFADGSIVLPAGARGPAFLVGPNFRTILRYNNANSYALGVLLLADQLAGRPPLQLVWPRDLHMLTRAQVLALQSALNAQGYDSGTPDGMVGPATHRAIRRYQHSLGLAADGYPTVELWQRLQTAPK